jgi:hypothetical protein
MMAYCVDNLFICLVCSTYFTMKGLRDVHDNISFTHANMKSIFNTYLLLAKPLYEVAMALSCI